MDHRKILTGIGLTYKEKTLYIILDFWLSKRYNQTAHFVCNIQHFSDIRTWKNPLNYVS